MLPLIVKNKSIFELFLTLNVCREIILLKITSKTEKIWFDLIKIELKFTHLSKNQYCTG